jgi:hypothetical protein
MEASEATAASSPKATAASSSEATAASYDVTGRVYANVTHAARVASYTVNVRYLNNGVKACLIDATCRALVACGVRDVCMVDAAGGRGQDVAKWMHGAKAAGAIIAGYGGMDLAPADVTHMGALAAKYLTTSAVRTDVLDIGTCAWPYPDASAHVVSCQLALHYLCNRQAALDHFFSETARVLVPSTGFALVSFADGSRVMAAARAAAAKVASSDPGEEPPAVVHVLGKYYGLSVPWELCTSWGDAATPFGHAYTFTMPDSVDGIPEYVCSLELVVERAAACGFHLVASDSFDGAAASMFGLPYFARLLGRMRDPGSHGDADAVEVAALYRYAVFARSKTCTGAFKRSLYPVWE